MESCNEKNFPRAGPISDGESRTVSEKSSDAVWPKYTGGATIASGSKEAAEAASGKEGANTRNSPGPALFAAPEPDQKRRTRRKDLATTKDLTTTNVATSNTTYQTLTVGVEHSDDSDCSLYTMRTASSRESSHDRAGSVTGKRRLPHSGSASDGGSEHSMRSEPSSRQGLIPAKRGRGRPPTSGEYVGYAAAKRQHLELEREALRLHNEKVATEALLKKQRKEQRKAEEVAARQAEQKALDELPPATRLKEVGERGLELIKMVRTKSGNLKGTFSRDLKEGEAKVEESVRGLAALKEDTLRLEAENIRLKEELTRLREKVSQAQEALPRPSLPTNAPKGSRATPHGSEELTMASLRAMFEDFSRSIMERTSNMINARIEAMEDRLLPAQRIRPPLAADSKRRSDQFQNLPALPRVRPSFEMLSAPATTSKTVAAPTPAAEPETEERRKVFEENKNKKGKITQKGNKGKEKSAQQSPAPSTSSTPGPSITGEAWNVVTRKGKKKTPDATRQEVTRTRPQGPSKAPRKPQSNRRPRHWRNAAPATTAVVITLQHDAVERGATYREALLKARQEINLAELGLTEGVRIRQAATGARIMELPKNATSEMADQFAEKLRGVLSGAARVTRPVI